MLVLDEIAQAESIFKEGILNAIVDIENALVELNYTDHTLELKELMNLPDLEEADKADQVVDVYKKHMRLILRSIGIILSAELDIPFTVYAKIIIGVLDIASPDMIEPIEHIYNEESDDTIAFCMVLNEVTDERTEYWLPFISEVDNVLLRNIRIKADEALSDKDIEAIARSRKRLKIILGKFPTLKDDDFAIRYIRQREGQAAFGFSFGLAMRSFNSSLTVMMQHNEHERAAKNISILLFASSLEYIEMLHEAGDYLEAVESDIIAISKILSFIERNIKEWKGLVNETN